MKKLSIFLLLFLSVILGARLNGTQSIKEEEVAKLEITEEDLIRELGIRCVMIS